VSKSWGDRESLERAEPRDPEEPACPLCGTRVAHPYEPGGTVLCHPERGGCGAIIRPVPYLVADQGERASPTAPAADRGWQSCCRPYTPVGLRLVHSRWCPRFPGSALTPAERDGYRAERRAKVAHPAGADLEVPDEAQAVRQVDVPGYADAHSDDDDDRGTM